MIERCVVSGVLGRAVCYDGAGAFVLFADSPDERHACRAFEEAALDEDGEQVFDVAAEGVNVDEVVTILSQQTDKADGLKRLIGGMNAAFSDETRSLSIEVAEELLENDGVCDAVRAQLLGRVPPEHADVEGAARLAQSLGAHKVQGLYEELRSLPAAIAQVENIWRDNAQLLDDDGQTWDRMVDHGVVAEFALGVAAQDSTRLTNAVFSFSQSPGVKNAIPRVANILTNFKALLSDASALVPPKPSATVVDKRAKPSAAVAASSDDTDPIESLILNTVSKLRAQDAKIWVQGEVLDKVQKQVTWISSEVRTGHDGKALNALEELVRFQLEHGGVEHLAKSLCAIATNAAQSHHFNFAQRVIHYAHLLNVEDPVVWTSDAQLLSDQGRFGEALAAYDAAMERFPDDVVVRNGRAEVLRNLGRFAEALAAYDAAMERFPDDVVVCSGRAEVLRDQGRFDEALVAYDAAMERFPDDVVVCSGRAEVLRNLGRFDKALAAYDAAMERFPDDVVVCSGRAEVLRNLGRFDEALAAYDAAMERFPHDAVAHTGRGFILGLLNRFDEAYNALVVKEPKTYHDWIAYHMVAALDMKQGLLDDAEKKLEYGFKNSPHFKNKAYFATALATCRIQMKKFDAAAEILDFDAYFKTRKGQQARTVLRVHAKAESGDLSGARQIFEELVQTPDNVLVFPVPRLKVKFEQRYAALSGQNDNQLDLVEQKRLDQEILMDELLLAA